LGVPALGEISHLTANGVGSTLEPSRSKSSLWRKDLTGWS